MKLSWANRLIEIKINGEIAASIPVNNWLETRNVYDNAKEEYKNVIGTEIYTKGVKKLHYINVAPFYSPSMGRIIKGWVRY